MAKASGSIDLKVYNKASQEATNYISYDPQTGLTVGQEDLDSKVVISGDGLKLYDEDGNIGTEITSTEIDIGTEDTNRIKMDENGIYIINPQGKAVSFFGEEILLGNKEDNHIVVTSKSFEQKTDNDIKVLDVRTDGEDYSTILFEHIVDESKTYERISNTVLYSKQVPLLLNKEETANIYFRTMDCELYPSVNLSGSYNIVYDPDSRIESVEVLTDTNTIKISISPFSLYGRYDNDSIYINFGVQDANDFRIEFTWEYNGTQEDCILHLDISSPSSLANIFPESSALYLSETIFEYHSHIDAPSYIFGTASSKPGAFSAIIGEGLDAKNDNQVVIGRLNAECDDAFVIGCGHTSLARFNSFSVEKYNYYAGTGGNTKVQYNLKVGEDIYAQGDVYVGCNNDSTGGQKVTSQAQGQVLTVSGVTAQSYKDYAVTFPTPYASTPLVVAGLAGTLTAYGMGMVSVAVNNVTTTGFTARVYNASSNDRNVTFRYIAIAP